MPELLKGDAHGLDIFAGQMAPPQVKAEVELESYRFRRESVQYPAKLGQPIDWVRLGGKKIGSVYRYSIFVCRYSKYPMFWYFGAYEMNGRWWPDTFRWGNDPRRLLDAVADGAQSGDEGCANHPAPAF